MIINESDNPLYHYPAHYEAISDDLTKYRRDFPDDREGALIIIEWLRHKLENPHLAAYMLHLGDSDAVAISDTFWKDPYALDFLQAHLNMSGFTYSNAEEMLGFVRLSRRAWLQQCGPAPMQYAWPAMEHITIQMLKDFGADFQYRTIGSLDCSPLMQLKTKIRCTTLFCLPALGFFSLFRNRRILIIGVLAHSLANHFSSRGYWEENSPWMAVEDMPQSVYPIYFPGRMEIKSHALFADILTTVRDLPEKPELCLLACGMSAFILAPELALMGITSIDIGSMSGMLCGQEHPIGEKMPAFRKIA